MSRQIRTRLFRPDRARPPFVDLARSGCWAAPKPRHFQLVQKQTAGMLDPMVGGRYRSMLDGLLDP